MNMKMRKLNAENERKAISHMFEQLNMDSTLFATKSLGIIIEEDDLMKTTGFAVVPKFRK